MSIAAGEHKKIINNLQLDENRFDDSMILYRPVSLQELELIYDSGMKTFPARLPQQPIFYPVLQLEYARQIAADWNVKSGQSAGYVTQFKVDDQYISQFEKHTVGGSQHQEFWIPAEEVEEFNKHIIGHIKMMEAYFGDDFQGFVPDQFGLQGKNAVEQFTFLANSYIYKRMDFYLEIKRNHKAVFLNYPFWQKYTFKNPGLKEKIIKAIREAWLTSFPKTPLANPIQENAELEKQSDSAANAVGEDIPLIEQGHAKHPVKPHDENVKPVTPKASRPFTNLIKEEIAPTKQKDAESLMDPLTSDVRPTEPGDLHPRVTPIREEIEPVKPAVSHFTQGIELGLSGKYHEAIEELSKATELDPKNVVAQTSLGVAFHRVDQDDRALSAYEAALKIDPNYAEAYYFRANILYDRGSVREAIAAYTMAIGLKPELIEAHQESSPQDRLTDYTRSAAEIYWIAKRAHRILHLNASLESNPRQANLFKERAAEYFRLRNYEQAIADYSSSLKIQPDDASALHFRGLAFEQMGQFDRALEDYQRAIVIDPQLSNVYINRGVTLGKLGNYRQSIVSLTEAIRLAPQIPDGYFNRGMTNFQIGDLNSAIDDFSHVIELSPKDEEAYYWRGISHEEAGHQPEAIADYKQFLAISQNAQAKDEIEQRLSQWDEPRQDDTGRNVVEDKQRIHQDIDLYELLVILGERALDSIWLVSGVGCSGEKAEALYAVTEQNRPIHGRDLLQIASGIRQTIEGDFTAFDPGENSHWIFIRAWHGTGFYIEINDSETKERLKEQFQSFEEVEDVQTPYEGLFIQR